MRRSVIADNMPVSGIRKMFALASEYENVINLCIGEPDFAKIGRASCRERV